MTIRQRFLVTGIISLGIGLMSVSCTKQPDTTSTTPPPPPRDSPNSPVRSVNPRMADKANLGMGAAVPTKKRSRQ